MHAWDSNARNGIRMSNFPCIGCDDMEGVCAVPSLVLNLLNAELNTICHLLTLLGAHPILHVSRIRVNMCPRWTWLVSSHFLPFYPDRKEPQLPNV